MAPGGFYAMEDSPAPLKSRSAHSGRIDGGRFTRFAFCSQNS